MFAILRNYYIVMLCLAVASVSAGGGFAYAEPPAGFDGHLFIDRSGCVMERNDKRWQPRLLRDGTRDCGYPPTPFPPDAGGYVGAGNDLPLPPDMPKAEVRLLVTMAEGLREDDLKDPRPAHPVKGVAQNHPVLREIDAALSPDAAAVKAQITGNQPNARLCGLLDQNPADTGAIGTDPTRGFCSGTGPDVLRVAMQPAAFRSQKPKHDAAKAVDGKGGRDFVPVPDVEKTVKDAHAVDDAVLAEADKPAAAAKKDDPVSAAVTTSTVASAVASLAQKAKPSKPKGGPVSESSGNAMIPAGARYLQLGVYADDEVAKAVFLRLAAMDVPAGRAKIGEAVLVMAGPFGSRQAIVQAYDRLLSAGFRGMLPR